LSAETSSRRRARCFSCSSRRRRAFWASSPPEFLLQGLFLAALFRQELGGDLPQGLEPPLLFLERGAEGLQMPRNLLKQGVAVHLEIEELL